MRTWIQRFIFASSLFSLLVAAQAKCASQEVSGMARWFEGQGDCPVRIGPGPDDKGTAYLPEFSIKFRYVLEDRNITFHFTMFNGKDLFAATQGTVDEQGNFEAKARNDAYDEDYYFQGKLGHDKAEGVFTRQAHYVGAGTSGPRCTARWKVNLQAGGTATPSTTHPTTVSKPPAVTPSPASGGSMVQQAPPEQAGSSGNALWIGGVIAGIGAGLWIIASQVKKYKKKPCDCSFSASFKGPTQINLPQCLKSPNWRIHPEPNETFRALLDVGDGSDRHYSAELKTTCSGGGSLTIQEVNWSASRKDKNSGRIVLDIKAIRHCPGETDATMFFTQFLDVSIAWLPCCGPDITDGYIAAINRIYRKLWKDIPFSSTVFMTNWGTRMIYRPHQPGAVFDNDCPSPGCNDTVTILDKCYDCFVGDNLLFGIVAGFLKISIVELEVGGWAAKLAKQFAIAPHLASEALWRKGHAIGLKSRERMDAKETFEFTRAMLAEAVCEAPHRHNCRPCETKGPDEAFIDFSREAF